MISVHDADYEDMFTTSGPLLKNEPLLPDEGITAYYQAPTTIFITLPTVFIICIISVLFYFKMYKKRRNCREMEIELDTISTIYKIPLPDKPVPAPRTVKKSALSDNDSDQPVPAPRNTMTHQPVPAPRNIIPNLPPPILMPKRAILPPAPSIHDVNSDSDDDEREDQPVLALVTLTALIHSTNSNSEDDEINAIEQSEINNENGDDDNEDDDDEHLYVSMSENEDLEIVPINQSIMDDTIEICDDADDTVETRDDSHDTVETRDDSHHKIEHGDEADDEASQDESSQNTEHILEHLDDTEILSEEDDEIVLCPKHVGQLIRYGKK